LFFSSRRFKSEGLRRQSRQQWQPLVIRPGQLEYVSKPPARSGIQLGGDAVEIGLILCSHCSRLVQKLNVGSQESQRSQFRVLNRIPVLAINSGRKLET
jgi:hypothetical protein